MILFSKKPRNTKNYESQVRGFGKTISYKITVQKLQACFNNSDNQLKTKMILKISPKQ